jgi:hypothetical protein
MRPCTLFLGSYPLDDASLERCVPVRSITYREEVADVMLDGLG